MQYLQVKTETEEQKSKEETVNGDTEKMEDDASAEVKKENTDEGTLLCLININ